MVHREHQLEGRHQSHGDDLHMEQGTSQLRADEMHIDTILLQTLQQATEFLKSIDDRPVGVRPQLPIAFSPPPKNGVGAEAALKLFQEKYYVGIAGSAGPRYCGFVTGGSTPAAIAGDWLVSTFDQNAAQPGDSVSHLIEKEALQWLSDMFGLPAAYSGTFVSGATMSNFVGLAIGRQWSYYLKYSLLRIMWSSLRSSLDFRINLDFGNSIDSVVVDNCILREEESC
jgi:hypothetical protein